MDQRSEDWYQARLGKVTASRIADVMAKTKTGWGASRKNYMAELVAERLTGVPAKSFTNAAMQHGIDTEPEAIATYEFMTDRAVEPVGFVTHPKISMSGASPDGLVGKPGLIEVKCPNTATHIDTLLNGTVPKKYALQMQWQMACTERDWCDFVSYDPRLPAEMQFWMVRIERDDELITEISEAVTNFLTETDEMVSALQSRYLRKAA